MCVDEGGRCLLRQSNSLGGRGRAAGGGSGRNAVLHLQRRGLACPLLSCPTGFSTPRSCLSVVCMPSTLPCPHAKGRQEQKDPWYGCSRISTRESIQTTHLRLLGLVYVRSCPPRLVDRQMFCFSKKKREQQQVKPSGEALLCSRARGLACLRHGQAQGQGAWLEARKKGRKRDTEEHFGLPYALWVPLGQWPIERKKKGRGCAGLVVCHQCPTI